MSLFARRTIQRCLDKNALFLTIEQRDQHVQQLNRGNRQSIACEWEVVLLSAFCAIGKVVHEPKLGGNRTPDLHLSELRAELVTAPETKVRRLRFGQQIHSLVDRALYRQRPRASEHDFIADITAVSDKTIEKDNPYEYFCEELGRQLRKRQLTLGGFDIQIGGDAVGDSYADRKMTLHLPSKKDIPAFIAEHLGELIDAVASRPHSPHSTTVVEDGIDVMVKYNPKDRETLTGGHPSYNIAYSCTRNPLANALRSKADQLRKTKYKGPRGIICCDGGCGLFAKKMGGALHYGHREIVEQFLRNNTSISFVVLVWIADEGWVWTNDRRREVHTVVYRSAIAERQLSDTAYQLMQMALSSLPHPIRTAANAVAAVESEHRQGGASFYGGWSMAGQQIRLSSRALADLLAGRIDQERFFKDHGSPPFNVQAFFEKQLAERRMIAEVDVESSAEQDDDWIVLRFGEPDPATAPFRAAPTRDI